MVEHSSPQQVEGAPPITLAFEQLQSVPLPFDLALAVGGGDSRQYGFVVAADAIREALEFRDVTCSSGFQPGVQFARRMGAYDAAKVLDEVLCRRNRHTLLTQLTQRLTVSAFLRIEISQRTHQEPAGLPW